MSRSILVADDEPTIQDALRRGLNADGRHFEIVTDGQEALKMIESHAFDLIILDLFMPEVDGIEVLQGVRRKGLKTPVIAMTGSRNLVYMQTARRLGALHVVAKPIQMPELRSLVDEILGD